VLAQLQAKVLSGNGVADELKSSMSLADFKPQFLRYIEAKSTEHLRTAIFYRQTYEKILEECPALASTRLDEIDEALIDRYMIELQGKLRVATINRRLATLRRALRLAYSWKLLHRVPAIKLLRGERQREFIFTPELEDKYLELAPEPLRSVFQFLIESGMRLSEALQLPRKNIVLYADQDNGIWGYIKNESGKTKYARRTVLVTAGMREVILRWMSLSPDAKLLFTTPDGRRPLSRHTLNDQARKVREKLGLPWDCVAHSCRHTFGTRLGMAGADVFTIQAAMGHASVAMSQRYVHPTPDSLKRAVRGMLEFDQKQRKVQSR
jgi:integrase